MLVRARWLIMEPERVVRDGAVLIGDDGRVTWSGDAQAAPAGAAAVRHEPGAVLVAGFVNAHSHLELTHLEGLVHERAFPDWIARVRRLKDATAPEEFAAAARVGLSRMLAQGVTTVADTGSTGAVAGALAELGGRGIVYQEVFGPDPSQAARALDELTCALDRLEPLMSERVRVGVSPHAPYTVSDALVREAGAIARERGLPLAMHVAESREEVEFVRSGAGPFAAAHRRRAIPVAPRARSTIAWLAALDVLDRDWLLIHGVQLDEADIETIAAHGAAVAHCPLSNAAHGHGRAPLARWLGRGIAVGLGTDSVASRAPLDVRAEARATGLTPEGQLELLTLGGARALGRADLGALVPGRWGDLAIVEAPDEGSDPVAAALEGPVLLTMVGGQVVYEAGSPAPESAAEWEQRLASARQRLGAT